MLLSSSAVSVPISSSTGRTDSSGSSSTASIFRKADGEGAVVPLEERVVHPEREFLAAPAVGKPVLFEKQGHIHDPSHDVGADRFADVAVLEPEGDGFVGVVVAHNFIDHGLMGADVFPQPFPGADVEINLSLMCMMLSFSRYTMYPVGVS